MILNIPKPGLVDQLIEKGRETLETVGNRSTQAVSWVADRAPALIGATVIGGVGNALLQSSEASFEITPEKALATAAAATLVLSSTARNGAKSLAQGSVTFVSGLPGKAHRASASLSRKTRRAAGFLSNQAQTLYRASATRATQAQAGLSRCWRRTRQKAQVAAEACGTFKTAALATCGEIQRTTLKTLAPYAQSAQQHLESGIKYVSLITRRLVSKNPAPPEPVPSEPRQKVRKKRSKRRAPLENRPVQKGRFFSNIGSSCKSLENLAKKTAVSVANATVATTQKAAVATGQLTFWTAKKGIDCVSKVGQVSANALRKANEISPALVGAAMTSAMMYATYQAAELVPSILAEDPSILEDLPSNVIANLRPNF